MTDESVPLKGTLGSLLNFVETNRTEFMPGNHILESSLDSSPGLKDEDPK